MSLRSKAHRVEREIQRLNDEKDRQRLLNVVDKIMAQMVDDIRAHIDQKPGKVGERETD